MKIVIDIPKEDYERLQLEEMTHNMTLLDAIREGIPYQTLQNTVILTEEAYNDLCMRAAGRTGKWIEHQSGWVSCNLCQTSFPKTERFDFINYCPYCGAKMEDSE